jgi:hypothetical protein
MGFWKRFFAGNAQSDPFTVEDKLRLVYALCKKKGIDHGAEDLPVIVGALKMGHKPENVVRVIQGDCPERRKIIRDLAGHKS